MEKTNFAHKIPLQHLTPDGFAASADGRNHKSLCTVIRLWEPDTQLFDPQEAYLRCILPLVNHFASEDSIGLNQQLQILRYRRRSGLGRDPFLEESLRFGGGKQEALALYQDYAHRQQAAGYIPDLRTYLFLSCDLGKVMVTRTELDRAKGELTRRTAALCQAFAQAGYQAVRSMDPTELAQPFWDYYNPSLSYNVTPPKPKDELQFGQLPKTTLARYPDAALGSIRRQLAASDVAFSPSYALGDRTYQAFLTLASLPDDAAHGFMDLFLLDADVVLSQTWLMSGKSSVAQELEKRHRLGIDLQNSFGDRVANLGLTDTVENLGELRRDLARSSNCARYTLTVRVSVPARPDTNLDDLEQAVALVQNKIHSYSGATAHRETGRHRLQSTYLQCSPGVPPALVDYAHRGHIARCDLLTWFLPRYGQPASDPLTADVPYVLFWTPGGNLCRKALQGPTSGTCMLVFGPPGTGKGVISKLMIQQLLFQSRQYVWTIDNNTELTSFDFQTLYNGGITIRFSEEGRVCLPTFDIAGTVPSPGELTALIQNLWLDIHGEETPLSGEVESLLTSALLLTYRRQAHPTYDTFVHILKEWTADPGYQPYHGELHRWAGSLERFCSGPFLSNLKGIPDHPAGPFYAYYGKPEGLRVTDLLTYPVVSWSLVELTNPYLKTKTAALLRKLALSFAELLKDQAIHEAQGDYYLNLFIDEGWGFFALDGGAFLGEITRRRRHFGLNVFFITQFVEDLAGPAGAIVRASANQWVLLGMGDEPEALAQTLKLTPAETQALMQLRRVPGVYGEFLYKRKLYNGGQEVHLLTNPIPSTDQGSWMALLTGAKNECILRQQLLQALGAPSIQQATPAQCQTVAQIFGQVWPNGLPTDSTDLGKHTREYGWRTYAQPLLQAYQADQQTKQELDSRYPLLTTLLVLLFLYLQLSLQPVQAQASFALCIGTDPLTGQTYTYPCDLKVTDPQNYDYQQSPAVTQAAPGTEYTYSRQQELLKYAIGLGQTNQRTSDTLAQQTTDTINAANSQVDQACNQVAYQAYQQAQQAYTNAANAFQSAAAAPYVFDQIASQNAAYQQFAQAQSLYATAANKDMECTNAYRATQVNLNRLNTDTNGYILKSLGQLQEAQAAQKQWEVDQAAQQGRTINGLQNTFTNLLIGLQPITPPPELRPTGY